MGSIPLGIRVWIVHRHSDALVSWRCHRECVLRESGYLRSLSSIKDDTCRGESGFEVARRQLLHHALELPSIKLHSLHKGLALTRKGRVPQFGFGGNTVSCKSRALPSFALRTILHCARNFELEATAPPPDHRTFLAPSLSRHLESSPTSPIITTLARSRCQINLESHSHHGKRPPSLYIESDDDA